MLLLCGQEPHYQGSQPAHLVERAAAGVIGFSTHPLVSTKQAWNTLFFERLIRLAAPLAREEMLERGY